MKFDPARHPHRRWNPLMEQWILVSPHRAQRPWSGEVAKTDAEQRPQYDPKCYLCPRNTRAGGIQNPDYPNTFVFDNDFAALLPDSVEGGEQTDCKGLVRTASEPGMCRVVCFSPRHDQTLAEMPLPAIRRVIDLWREQFIDLASREFIQAVTIFENKGAMMGCSNPHPHGQIWANHHVPTLLEAEVQSQQRYFEKEKSSLLLDYLKWEQQQKERILFENDCFTALVPHWAVWPFEAMILPNHPVSRIDELTNQQQDSWAEILKQLLVWYDNLFLTSFPYSMGIHQAPTDGQAYPGFQLHQHFFPPLLRSATVKKFQVGYEMSGEPQRDITPEQAAERLRSLPTQHYREQSK